jgi:hypothetical protein
MESEGARAAHQFTRLKAPTLLKEWQSLNKTIKARGKSFVGDGKLWIQERGA